jgi:hypothetical protein
MPHPDFQIVNINLSALKNFRPHPVCDISPLIGFQVVNVEGISEGSLLASVRAVTAWDMSNSLSQEQLQQLQTK